MSCRARAVVHIISCGDRRLAGLGRGLRFDYLFEAGPALDSQRGAVNLNELFLLESREKPRDGFARCADYLRDFLVCECKCQANGTTVLRFRI